MRMKIEPLTVLLVVLICAATTGGFFAGRATKPAEVYETEYITQNQTQAQWQAQITISVIDSDFQSNVVIQLDDLTNISVNAKTNFLTNLR